jgi:hypothetical protein
VEIKLVTGKIWREESRPEDFLLVTR